MPTFCEKHQCFHVKGDIGWHCPKCRAEYEGAAVPRPEAERAQKPEETMSQEDETMRKDTDRMLLNLCDNERPPASEWGFSGYLAKLPAEPSARPEAERAQEMNKVNKTEREKALDELVRAEIDEGLYYRQPVEPSAQPAGMCKGDLVERICRAICKVEAIDPDSGEDTDGPNWVRYADAVHQEVLQTAQPAGSAPQEFRCDVCDDVHDEGMYFDPESEVEELRQRIAEVVEDRRLTLNKFAALESEVGELRDARDHAVMCMDRSCKRCNELAESVLGKERG